MSLEALRDTSVEPYEDGRSWGSAGSYEWVSAIAEFAVDPCNRANEGVTDLALASLAADRDGLVRFDADLTAAAAYQRRQRQVALRRRQPRHPRRCPLQR